MRRQDQIDDQHPILLSAFHNVARLYVDFFTGNIFNRKFVYRARLADDHLPLHERFRKLWLLLKPSWVLIVA